MNVFYKPHCLTVFLKVENYEFVKAEIEPEDEDLYEFLEEDIEYIKAKKEDIDGALYEGKYTYFNPLEDAPNLYTDLAKIGKKDKKGLMDFIKEYGLPMGEALIPSDIHNVLLKECPDYEVFSAIEEFKKALTVYHIIRDGDPVEIEKLKDEFDFYLRRQERTKGLEVTFNKFDEKDIYEEIDDTEIAPITKWLSEEIGSMPKPLLSPLKKETREQLKDRDPQAVAMAYLTELLNRHGKGNSSYALIDGQIQPGTTFKDLIEVAYFQLSRAVIGNIALRPCEHCGALFEVTHESRRFCPPHKDNKISTCQNSYNQRIKRKRKKARELHKEGMSLNEIVSKIKMPADEVRQWLE
jgi:hypothetical protein